MKFQFKCVHNTDCFCQCGVYQVVRFAKNLHQRRCTRKKNLLSVWISSTIHYIKKCIILDPGAYDYIIWFLFKGVSILAIRHNIYQNIENMIKSFFLIHVCGVLFTDHSMSKIIFYQHLLHVQCKFKNIYTVVSNWYTFCLFVWLGLIVPFVNFSLIWIRYHYRWRAANFDLCSAPWTLSSEDYLAFHTFYDTGHPFKMVISENAWHPHICRAFGSGAVTTCFYDLGLSWLGFELPTFRLRGERSNPQTN